MSKEAQEKNTKPIPKCGIVMPISTIDGCPPEHWLEVLGILKEIIKDSGFEPNLVSDSDESGIIQKRIIRNLYNNEIVVCDVSAKNPNVMFELGLRLAFDKPTIIIKDDQTDYSFDTSIIEHVSYPRDLRFTKILSFKEILRKKIEQTFKASNEDENYTTFLKHFGEFTIANLGQKEVSSEKFILESLNDLRESVERLGSSQQSDIPFFHNKRIESSYVRKNLLNDLFNEFAKNNKLKNKNEILDKGLVPALIKFLQTDAFIANNYSDEKELKTAIANNLL